MKKTLKRSRQYFAVILVAFVIALLVGTVSAEAVYADTDNTTGNVTSDSEITVSVEKFTLGQGYIVEPRTMKIEEDETYESVIKRLAEEKNLELNCRDTAIGFYLAGINNSDSGNTVLPYCIEELSKGYLTQKKILPADEKNSSYPHLEEFCYTQTSGWMYEVNNSFPGVGMDQTIAQDGDVVRFMFTIYGQGADVGSTLMNPNALVLPNLDEATVLLAELGEQLDEAPNATNQSVYDAAINAVSNMDHSQDVVDVAAAALEAAIAGRNVDTLLAELDAIVAKEDAEIAAKRNPEKPADEEETKPDPDPSSGKTEEPVTEIDIDAITPGDVSANAAKEDKSLSAIKVSALKRVAKSNKKTLTYSWPKVKGAVNYRVAYKKAADKKWTYAWTKGAASYTLKKLKAGGLYNFKVAAYKKTNGKWVKSKWSVADNLYFRQTTAKVTGIKNGFTANIKKVKDSNGYQVRYSLKKNLQSAKTKATKKAAQTNSKVTKLKAKKNYYVTVQPVKKYKGKTYIGIGSKPYKVKTK